MGIVLIAEFAVEPYIKAFYFLVVLLSMGYHYK